MIDGIRAILSENLDEIRCNPLLNFIQTDKVSIKTGEVQSGKYPVAKYQGLTFIDKGSVIEVKGSIHVYCNNGMHNYNHFGLSDIHLTLFELADKLSILITNAELKNIEFGVNLEVNFKPSDFLNSLIIHKSKMFTHRIEAKMNYRECVHRQYFIKIYDKGLQNGLNKYILRIELKFIVMEKINAFGIKYLSDLLDSNKLHLLQKELLRVYDEILIGDIKAEPEGLSVKEQLLFVKGHNANYWASNLPCKESYADIKSYQADKTSYYREMARFRKLLTKTGADEKQKLLRSLTDVKCNDLLTIAKNEVINLAKCVKLNNNLEQGDNEKVCQIEQIDRVEEMCQIDPLFYSNNKTHIKERVCLVTGLDISMQKEDSHFLYKKGLRCIIENDNQKYQELRLRYLPRSGVSGLHTKYEQDEITHIAKQIRNEYHNKRRYFDHIPKNQLSLF